MARVLIAAGASGGHVYPGLATAEALRARGNDVLFAGGDRLESRLVPAAGFEFHPLPVRRPPSVRVELVTPRGLRSMGSIVRATLVARRLIGRVRPDVVLGMGGFAAVPVSVAAGLRRVPLVLHEQNANLSFAQRIPLRWAHVLALGLPLTSAVGVRTELVGHPVRSEIRDLAALDAEGRSRAKRQARARLGLPESAEVLFVFGGSLGSGPLNDLVPQAPLPPGLCVLHLSGSGREEEVRRAWERAGVSAIVLGYLDTIQDAYAAADVAVARSGAASVAELALVGLPAVLVPLPTLARGDQEANARVLERSGGAVVVAQSHPNFIEMVGREVSRILSDESARVAMSAGGRAIARPDAAQRLADLVEDAAAAR
ncbi:MAG TPA: UDP-N-acetylglucosamine--N-acetylmuramyl-(pentapeptide) pyrophosphoryl-undecaprenol N-acetylglucosamine transferase [Actinomycetota bacterium]|nr:UDP-N-acetylglucosamine--N-acetylmuramyl-(pentapeptide) pyrophosphoryl-undecaprenol N-acetylglucosamine transferase [Actinomycetota bacterium]